MKFIRKNVVASSSLVDKKPQQNESNTNSGHSSQNEQVPGISVLKSSNVYCSFFSMIEAFPENFSFIAQFNFFLWLL